jgi:hypothetical protein
MIDPEIISISYEHDLEDTIATIYGYYTSNPDPVFIIYRLDGPSVIYKDGGKYWWKHGKLHREDGPAVEENDYNQWCVDGLRHREDGPAIVFFSQEKNNQWWYHNKHIAVNSHEQFLKAIKYLQF